MTFMNKKVNFMKPIDLYEIIETWISIYRNLTRPDVYTNIDEKYAKGLLKVASVLKIIEEVKNTPIEKYLSKAIEEAKSGDFSKLDEINIYLNEVEKNLRNKISENSNKY